MWLPPALLLLSLPGCFSLQGPGSVRGRERGSLTVWCDYGRGYETYVKYWCRGAAWGSCKILVGTTGSEQEVKTGRVSIRDHQKHHVFAVTMEALTLGDADTYWCGVDKTLKDLGAQVKVTVDPATMQRGVRLLNPRTSANPEWLCVCYSPSLLGAATLLLYFICMRVTKEETLMNTRSEIIGDNHAEVTSGSHSRTHHMLLVFVKVPILLLVVGAVLWLKPPRQARSSGVGSPSLPTCPLDV